MGALTEPRADSQQPKACSYRGWAVRPESELDPPLEYPPGEAPLLPEEEEEDEEEVDDEESDDELLVVLPLEVDVPRCWVARGSAACGSLGLTRVYPRPLMTRPSPLLWSTGAPGAVTTDGEVSK